MSWHIQIGEGTPEAFSTLGCNKLKRELRSQAAGTFSFTETTAQMDGGALAGNLTPCMVLWVPDDIADPVPQIYFQGRVTALPRIGAPANEERRYVISDAWNDLERLTYQQQWNKITGFDESGNPTTATEYRSEFILGMNASGNPQNSDTAMEDVLNWAIGRGAWMQIGQILVGGGGAAPVPYKEMHDLPCSAVMQELMRLTPDAVSWFDYATTPPTFHVTRRAACTSQEFPFAGAPEDIHLTPRNDLVRSEVVLRYVQEGRNDGQPVVATTIDAAPGGADGLAFDALVATVRLAGADAVYQHQPVKVKPIQAIPGGDDDTDACNWWGEHVQWLYQFSAERLNLDNDLTGGYVESPQYLDDGVTAVDYALGSYPSELASGNLADWMGVKFAYCMFYSSFTYNYPDVADEESLAAVKIFGGSTDGTSHTAGDQTPQAVACRVLGTSAVSQTYKQLSSYTEAEPVPAGLASALYGALSTLHYEGSYTFVQAEVNPTFTLGTVLNIAGSGQPWSTMNALVQEMVDDLDAGRSTWRVGPPAHLTIQDLMEQLRWTRTRAPSGHIKERASGTPSAPLVNGTTKPVTSSPIGTPTAITKYPWIGAGGDQMNGDGTAATYDAVLGYGQSSFAGDVGHAKPLEEFEISVGNDGSDWSGPDYDASALDNGLSIITGDGTADDDCIEISRGNGKVGMYPNTPKIDLTMDDNDNEVLLDCSVPSAQVTDDSGNVITIDGSSTSMDMTDASGNNINLDGSTTEISLNDASGNTIYIEGATPNIDMTSSGGSEINITAATPEIAMTGSGGGTITLDGSVPSIEIEDSGDIIDIDGSSASIDMTSSGGNNLNLDATTTEISLNDSSGSTISMDGSTPNIDITSSGGSEINIDGSYPKIEMSNGHGAVATLQCMYAPSISLEDESGDQVVAGITSSPSVEIGSATGNTINLSASPDPTITLTDGAGSSVEIDGSEQSINFNPSGGGSGSVSLNGLTCYHPGDSLVDLIDTTSGNAIGLETTTGFEFQYGDGTGQVNIYGYAMYLTYTNGEVETQIVIDASNDLITGDSIEFIEMVACTAGGPDRTYRVLGVRLS